METRSVTENNVLPDKPSALIRLALADLRKVEAQPENYQVEMSVWHAPVGTRKIMCCVCLAGSVMAMTFNADYKELVEPFDYGEDAKNKFLALDAFRCGAIYKGLELLDINSGKVKIGEFRAVPPYGFLPSHREKFHKAMNKLANDFEKVGL